MILSPGDLSESPVNEASKKDTGQIPPQDPNGGIFFLKGSQSKIEDQ